MIQELKNDVKEKPYAAKETRKAAVTIPHITESNSSRRLREKNNRIAAYARKKDRHVNF
ncbi:hypothetical protein SAMN05421736_1331 [Evansella caseinilytica]|uniref:Uncharacterized protein n=1 Tax=Evansella caseinilytica TaxID=1503961 RepID=A0A1H3V106_9BACI|nr:hypothetical protein [Evansella caseinilytica]SDZ68226.1 hypothetical protein SAMN05421736_1331 [Evansella caseinilytica]